MISKTRARLALMGAGLAAQLVSCGGGARAPAARTEAARPLASASEAPPATSAPTPPMPSSSAAAPSSRASRPTTPASAAPTMVVLASMRSGGDLESAPVVTAIEARAAALGACVREIRKTDAAVGSLNVQLTVRAPDSVSVELQTPLAEDAKRCVLGALDGLSVPRGTGTIMLLLGIRD